MANDYVERLPVILETLIGCTDSEGYILEMDSFNMAIEELAYIVNKMFYEVE